MSVDPMKAVLEAQKMAMEMQEKMMRGELDPTQMASEYMNAVAGMMPDLSALQGMAAYDPIALLGEELDILEDEEEDDTDYNIPENLMQLCDYIVDSMDAVRQLPAAPAVAVNENDPKWLQLGILSSGVLSNLNGHRLDGLSVEEPGDEDYIAKAKEGLRDSWGIEDREDLLEKLTWLSEEGHSARYLAFCKAKNAEALMNDEMDEDDRADSLRGFLFANRFKDSKNKSAMLGWDLGRSALLIRYGFYVGWLSEAQASSMLIATGKTLSETYGSWQEFGVSYQFGGAFWKVMGDPSTAKENDESIVDAITELLTLDMLGTVGEWNTFPWLLKK